MDKYISISLNLEGIVSFYDRCAEELGYNPGEIHYDCRKLEVSPNRFDVIQAYYLEKGTSLESIAQMWVIYGPKTNEELTGEVVCVHEGFIDE